MNIKTMPKIILMILVIISLNILGYTRLASAQRLFGSNRYQTACTIATAAYPGTVKNVVLATGNDFPDALAGSVLAYQLNAPILLVGSSISESGEALSYIKNHLAKNGTIYLLGTVYVISQEFTDVLSGQGFMVKQVGGPDRYATSEQIAQEEKVPLGTPIVIASGENFPDALSISSFAANKGYPILLVGKDTLPDIVKSFLAKDQPTHVYIVGGPGVVSDNVQTKISSIVGNTDITRLSGRDRFETGINITKEFAPNPSHIYVASGQNFPDALTGSILAAHTGSPIILVDPDSSTLPSPVISYLQSLQSLQGNAPAITSLGGISAVPDALVARMQELLPGIPPQDSNPSSSQSSRVTPVVTAVAGVSLNKPTLTLTIGGVADTLVATVSPANATDPAITWTTSKPAIATVKNGVVTPVGAGTAIITATTKDGAKAATCTVTVTPATVIESLGIAADLSGFYSHPLLKGQAAPGSTFTVLGVAWPNSKNVNIYQPSKNASFVIAPFNSYPALSPLPSQGLALNLSSEKTCSITNVDGYTLASASNNVTVSVNSLGEASVNDVKLWQAQTGYKVVGYLTSMSGSTTLVALIEENLATPTHFIGVNIPSVGSNGFHVATWTLPSTSLPGNFEEFIGFKVNSAGQLQPMVASYYANNNNTFAPYSTSVATFEAGVFSPVEAAQVYASDTTQEVSVINVSSSLNSNTAKVTSIFYATICGSPEILMRTPTNINGVLSGSQIITWNNLDSYGNPIANQTIYLGTEITGLWITQVNGNTITGDVNMGTTSSPSMQTADTPVPLFNLGTGASAPAYSSASAAGLTAYHLNDNSTPVVALTTGDDGKVSVTLADGNVTYVANTASTTVTNSYKVDLGTEISQQYLNLFHDSALTQIWESVPLKWVVK